MRPVSKFLILFLLLFHNQVKSQDINSEKAGIVKEINDFLKNNPYTDTFQEITFYYSIEVTPLNEFIVNLEYDGPFKTIYKVLITDLNLKNQDNPAMVQSTYLCWKCKPTDGKECTSCVGNEIIYTSGDKELHTSGEICVMFSNDKKVYRKLSDAFDRLFSEFTEKN